MWKLSDLSSSSSVIILFLFKDVYQKHWKTPQGQVVALLNPDKMQTKEVIDISIHKTTVLEGCISQYIRLLYWKDASLST